MEALLSSVERKLERAEVAMYRITGWLEMIRSHSNRTDGNAGNDIHTAAGDALQLINEYLGIENDEWPKDVLRPYGFPKIVCLCGSTRFWEMFRDKGLELTLAGKIVLSIGTHAPDSMVLAHPDTDEGKAQKKMLDDLHKRKIDLADEVLILNVNGYIGESTRSEMQYAVKRGKLIKLLNMDLPPKEELTELRKA